MTWGFVAVGVGTAAAAGIGAASSANAAGKQASASKNAARTQQDQWSQTQDNLAPYINLGKGSINPLIQAMGYQASQDADGNYIFTKDASNPLQQTFSYGPFSAPTADQAAQTPGYQFTQQQGLKAVQNSAAARGLGTSGAALKGAASYATGLADSTYNDVFNRALSTYNSNYGTAQSNFQTNYNTAANNFNRLNGLVSNGINAAATNGSIGAASTANIANTLTGGANAQAAGVIGAGNALSNGINGIANTGLAYGLTTNNAGAGGGYNPSAPVASGTTSGNNQYGFTV